jgi:hypothetical protein
MIRLFAELFGHYRFQFDHYVWSDPGSVQIGNDPTSESKPQNIKGVHSQRNSPAPALQPQCQVAKSKSANATYRSYCLATSLLLTQNTFADKLSVSEGVICYNKNGLRDFSSKKTRTKKRTSSQ